MMRRRAALAVLCAVAAVAAGCGTSPPARFYALSSTAAPPSPPVPPATLLIAVGPVTIPAVVDRPEIVVNVGQNELRIDEFNRWAAPLQDGVARAIAENRVVMLGTPRVILFPQQLATDPEYRVAVEIRTFETVPGTGIRLDAVWTLRRATDGRTETGRTSAREAVADASYDALAAAHSRAVARLSQDIAAAVTALQRAPG
jgi:uncharacterized lipoprotein YmbA